MVFLKLQKNVSRFISSLLFVLFSLKCGVVKKLEPFYNLINRKISDGHAKTASTEKFFKRQFFSGHQYKFENKIEKDRALL